MPSTILKKLPDAPVIVLTEPPGANILSDMQEGMDIALALVSEQPVPIFLIIDITDVPMRIDQISMAANMAARGPGALLHHPNVRQTIFVTARPVMKLGLKIMSGTAYNHLPMSVVDTLDEALEFCRSHT